MSSSDERLYRTIAGFPSYAQAHQDLFVCRMLDFKRAGTYLEIGAGDPMESNNTWVLERDYGWTGVSLEIDTELVQRFNSARRNSCIQADATTIDYTALLPLVSVGGRVDYLSLDIEPAATTFHALQRLPLSEYRFSVITYEHDSYVSGPEWMLKARACLARNGYQRVVSNVMVCGRDFEDWWIDPLVVPETTWKPFVADVIECAEIFKPGS